MIDEKVLIERLEEKTFKAELYNDEFDGTTVDNLICLGDVEDTIKNLASQHNNGWISVEDRLPEDGEVVIFATEAGMVESGWYDANKNWCVTDSYFPGAFLFIAWQPLPAPYKKGE